MHRSGKYPSIPSLGREHTEDPDPHRPDSGRSGRSDNNEPIKKDLLSDLFASAKTKHRENDLFAELTRPTAPPNFLPYPTLPPCPALPTDKKDEKINISIEAPVITISMSGLEREQETPSDRERTRVIIPACNAGCRTAKPRFKR